MKKFLCVNCNKTMEIGDISCEICLAGESLLKIVEVNPEPTQALENTAATFPVYESDYWDEPKLAYYYPSEEDIKRDQEAWEKFQSAPRWMKGVDDDGQACIWYLKGMTPEGDPVYKANDIQEDLYPIDLDGYPDDEDHYDY